MANPDTNPPIQSYNVEYRLSFELQRQQDNGTLTMRFNITGLYPSALYLVQVRAESPKGVGEPSMEISVWTEPGGRPCVTWRVGARPLEWRMFFCTFIVFMYIPDISYQIYA